MMRCLERDIVHVPVGQAVAAAVVADQAEALGQKMLQGAAKRIVPFVLDTGEPVGGSHQRHALAGTSDREIDAVARAAERDLRRARTLGCLRGWRSEERRGG